MNVTLAEDLKKSLAKGSKVSIASACFSIYAFEELKKELKSIDSLRFIFTSPTFLKEKAPREKKEFYIPRLSREKSVYGTEFEVKLRNGLTQKAIARECADWVRAKCEFRSNTSYRAMDSMVNIESRDSRTTYRPVKEFTAVGIGSQRGDSISMYITKLSGGETLPMFSLFDQIWNNKELLNDVKEDVVRTLTQAYDENPPEFIYYVTLYNIFKEFLEDITGDNLPNEGIHFRDSEIWKSLYSFQRDAVLGIINKLETFNGCILADSVGLGKTYTALGVIKYYESRNKNVLVLCPKKLSENWNLFRNDYKTNPLVKDKFSYRVLFHTDLSRKKGMSNGIDLKLFNWENYDLVVIDESHNFRNGGNHGIGTGVNRYNHLLDDVIRPGAQTKVLMLSATPVNNRFYDLLNQLRIAYAGNPRKMDANMKIWKPLDGVFKDAQKAFNEWSKQDSEDRTTEDLLHRLDFDFFKVLDNVTIARSRKHIERYYGMDEVGSFPERLKPVNLAPGITDTVSGVTYEKINESLLLLKLAVYVPTQFILPSKRSKYGLDDSSIDRAGREQGIRRLMGINLLKRLESSVYAFRMTIDKVRRKITSTIKEIERFENGTKSVSVTEDLPDIEDEDEDEGFAIEHEIKVKLEDMDYLSWKNVLVRDREILDGLYESVSRITPDDDLKLKTLKKLIIDKVSSPINPGNRKLLIFSTFADTADYLYDNLHDVLKREHGLNVAEITGNVDGKNTLTEIGGGFNDTLTWFSPNSKHRSMIAPDAKEEVDILIATDCISEGQNLQDCDCCVDYDIHWNPVRIIQRFGRVDRIGSKNRYIQLINFWPNIDLDEYINLKGRVEARMKASVLISTGDDNILDQNEMVDLEYRKKQLMKLKDEVVDIEDMQSGVSIMDLGLNEFKVDLLAYTQTAGSLDSTPFGLHAVVPSSKDMPPGVIFVLLNRVDKINENNKNRLHPFYMVYIADDGSIVCNHLDPKHMLDLMRYACKGKSEIYTELCDRFNEETDDGRNMKALSSLLTQSIDSIIEQKEQSDLDDFFNGNDSFSTVKSTGLDDFELVCFLAVRRCSAFRNPLRCASRSRKRSSSPSSGSKAGTGPISTARSMPSSYAPTYPPAP